MRNMMHLELCLPDVNFVCDHLPKIRRKPLGTSDIARSQGMTKVTTDSGLSRVSFCKIILSMHIPTFDQVLMAVSVLGIELSASVRNEADVS
jgi:DNA-binding phage protein